MNRDVVRRSLLAIALVVVAAEPFLFWNAFAGDAQVHLVFMENASHGRFFDFNPGERVSGETSPGYMMLGALLFRLLPATAVPLALKLVGVLSWYALCWLVWRVTLGLFNADDRGENAGAWAGIAAFVAATFAGSVYNANVGMENGLFAAVFWGWIALVSRRRWFDGGTMPLRNELAISATLGVAGWLRPEAFVVALVAWGLRLSRTRPPARNALVGAFATFGFGALAFAFETSLTGDVVPTSILSRQILAMPHTFALGSIVVNPMVAERLLVYVPATGLFIVGLKLGHPRPIWRFLEVILGIFVLLLSLGGSPHVARYLIFLMPVLAIGAARGAARLWQTNTAGARSIVVIAGASIMAINAAEASRRARRFPPTQLWDAANAVGARRARTDELLAQLGARANRPVVVALESVQIRYELDDRVIVRSLDGRVDRLLLRYVGAGTVDHLGYLRARRVDALLDHPSYNRGSAAWSLSTLRRLKPGETLAEDGLAFRRLMPRATYQVSRE
jgi:hypothetical protein